MIADTKPPQLLKKTQQWFASIITRPIGSDNRMKAIAPSGRAMSDEARDFIAPSPTMRGDQRIEIYNQQYWWRLLSTLQESFPFLTRLFGYEEFNRVIAFPYLVKYPSDTWSLSYLGNRLPQWIDEEYEAEDKSLVLHAAHLDWAYNYSFIAPQGTPIDLSSQSQDLESILDQPLTLQPHVFLFALPYNLFEYRFEFLKQDPNYWVDHEFPVLKHEPAGELLHYVLYRNKNQNIAAEKVSSSSYQLLQQFVSGSTIDAICQWLEQQPADSLLSKEASENLHFWFQQWTMHQWLSLQTCCQVGTRMNTDKHG